MKTNTELMIEIYTEAQKGNYKKAISLCNDALDKGIDHAHSHLGMIYEQMSNYDEAIKHHNLYLEKRPEDAMSMVCIARCYKKKGKETGALVYLEKAMLFEHFYSSYFLSKLLEPYKGVYAKCDKLLANCASRLSRYSKQELDQAENEWNENWSSK